MTIRKLWLSAAAVVAAGTLWAGVAIWQAARAVRIADRGAVGAVAAEGERKAGEMVPVRLEAHVTEVGTLELWCVARDGHGRWKLEYSVRERE